MRLFVISTLFISWMLLLPIAASAYSPPIGIPAPAFGITEQAPASPASWPATESAGAYYIDNSHPNASDIFNTYGTPKRPRKTIPDQVFPAGSYVELHGGPYKQRNLRLRFDCHASKPCWLRGTANSKPLISGSFYIHNSRYVILEHLNFSGGTGGAIGIVGKRGNHIAIRHTNVQNRRYVRHTSGISIQPAPGGHIHDVVIYKSQFRKLGDWQTSKDEDFHGVTPNLWGRNASTSLSKVWILENEFSHISGNGVQVIAGNWKNSYKYLHHIYVGRNVGHHNRQTAFWSKQASDVIFSQNISYAGRRHGKQPGDGIGFQYGPDNIWIIFNTIYDSNYGIRQSSTNHKSANRRAYIVGNLIYDIHPLPGEKYDPNHPTRPGVAIALWHGSMHRYVIDNTIHDVHGGLSSVHAGPLTLSGNIISGIDVNDYHMSIYNSAPMTKADHLLFDSPTGMARFRWRSTTYVGLNKFQAISKQCANCIVDDPQFTNSRSHNYHLQKKSPARNKGRTSDVYDVFFKRYGIDIRKDHSGAPRPSDGKMDLGAFEGK